jgi:uncharacterized membrane protein YvbJ
MAFCQNCGNELNDGDAFCPECGAKVGTVSETTHVSETTSVSETGKSYKIPIIVGYVMALLTLIGGGIIWPIISIAIGVYLITRPEVQSNPNNNISNAIASLTNDPSGVIKDLIYNPDDNLYLHALLLIAVPIVFFIIHLIFAAITAPEEEWYYVVWYE